MNEHRDIPEYFTPGIILENDGRDRSQDAGVPVIGVSRHRIGVDGKGITTLVAFHGCSLGCKYCINPQCLGLDTRLPRYTPENLYDELQRDDLYFRATGGGVTFGGGEPCLQADFIVRFREICGPDWKINVETSLNVDREYIEKLARVVDEWIVDIKTDDPAKYLEYTGKDIKSALRNLHYLVDEVKVPEDRILLRIPVIPGLTDAERAESTRQRFANEGFTRFDVFSYRTDKAAKDDAAEDSGIGKAKCNLLREIREEIAARAGSSKLPPHNCSHSGNCPGTCPRCESEMGRLSRDVQSRDNLTIKVSEELSRRIDSFATLSNDEDITVLNGDVAAPPELDGQVAFQPPQVYKKIFFKECPVAGLSFHIEKDDDLWSELEEGTRLALVRDRGNKHDRNAVAVALADDYDGDPDDFDFDFILGYIPRTDNAEIAALMDAGYADKISAEITTLKQYGPYNDRIRITIYVESREPVVQRPDLLRAQWLDDDAYHRMIAGLKEQGFATFRWGGFPPRERGLPETGDKIVMLHEENESVGLHLMHVLMTGEDCLQLGIDPDEVFAVDDCIHFALTNVAGPLTAPLDSLRFLSRPAIQEYSAPDCLSPAETDAFKRMFGITHAIRNTD